MKKDVSPGKETKRPAMMMELVRGLGITNVNELFVYGQR